MTNYCSPCTTTNTPCERGLIWFGALSLGFSLTHQDKRVTKVKSTNLFCCWLLFSYVHKTEVRVCKRPVGGKESALFSISIEFAGHKEIERAANKFIQRKKKQTFTKIYSNQKDNILLCDIRNFLLLFYILTMNFHWPPPSSSSALIIIMVLIIVLYSNFLLS